MNNSTSAYAAEDLEKELDFLYFQVQKLQQDNESLLVTVDYLETEIKNLKRVISKIKINLEDDNDL